MGKHKAARTDERSADALVSEGRRAEKQLLRLERQAEESLTGARAKLRKAQMRLERRLSAVSDAEALLRTRQAARTAGPTGANGASHEALPAAAAASAPGNAGDSPIILVDGGAPDGATADAESAATLVLPPAAKTPAKRRTSRSTAPKATPKDRAS